MSKDNRQTRSQSKRRTLLKKLGLGAAVGSGLSVGAVGSVTGSPDQSIPNPDPDKHVPGPSMEYGFDTDSEWIAHREEAEDSLNLVINADNPGSYPIDLCYTTENQEACVQGLGETFSIGQQPCVSCPSGHTPTLNYTTATLHDFSSGVSFDMWMGVNMNTGCLWGGNESSGYAKKFQCDMKTRRANLIEEPQNYEGPIESLATDVTNWVANNEKKALVVGGGLLLVAAATFGPGVAGTLVLTA
ncbi:hypothetical protein [Halobacterium litoreum]|uniref:Tat (Twin-arginine translocation) pathway signal sequence n=1 Tax=Halobacterium litoreum TaxID=2039234 RepID=A0ABD5NAL9_9EURY|nr:hypothetical protein [Halobacterium litoreum]UHH14759.1 hypothetical protein LT972_07085 [Halobacterium litoreum]